MDDGVDAKALHEAWSESLRQTWNAAERVDEHWSQRWEGTDRDVRVVVARMPVEVRDGFAYGRVPWGRFAHAYGTGVDVPDLLEWTRSADVVTAREGLGSLGNSICHQGTRGSVAPLTVPFLLRIAADRTAHTRAGALRLVAVVARRNFWDDGSRAGLLRAADPDDSWHFDVGGYLQNWTVEAARDAIAADAHIPIALLHDPEPDPAIREAAGYALAAASGRAREISTALHTRLGVEEDARVRAGLVLAIAQLAHEHDPGDTAAFARALWSDPTGPAEVRVSAALGWLCLVDDPVPDALRAVIEESVTPELRELLSPSPWMRQVEDTGVDGLSHTLWQMLDPDTWPGPAPEPCFDVVCRRLRRPGSGGGRFPGTAGAFMLPGASARRRMRRVSRTRERS
ncbi:hypothetical protein OG948_36960 (plasmid) [Embleya sp. NBC_00888]|uniref:hypothetical protein n=1 Tax=Embleya sp. NBC_00888 TaxID=2975960 RepID=UPI002F910E6E|nr:hypothetical protein OG948_36960 [Embleya sp. NBC_00888]